MQTTSVGSPQDNLQVAIETTGRLGSIAVLRGQEVLRQTNLDPDRRTAASLAPELQQTLQWFRECDQTPRFVSVSHGPGSFTGLRIGVTTAKSLAYALDLPVVAVDSLAAIAAATFVANPSCQQLVVAVDAYRAQVFAGRFNRVDLLPDLDDIPPDWTPHPPDVRVLGPSRWLELLEESVADWQLAGDAKPFGRRSTARLERGCDAVGVGLIALRARIRGISGRSAEPRAAISKSERRRGKSG